MNWINKLEKKFGKYAVPNLMNYIIVIYAAGFLMYISGTGFYENYLCLDMAQVFRGQVWRLFTFIFLPPSYDFLGLFISLYFYYMIGKTLEYRWGSFLFNLYYLVGMLMHILAALIVYLLQISIDPLSFGTVYLNFSIFLAFAAEFPDMQVLLFWLIPIKVKWLALVEAALYAWIVVQGILARDWATVICILVSLGNFALFFFSMKNMPHLSPKQVKRRVVYQAKVKKMTPKASAARHKCAICGRTELDGGDLEFRYCSKCEGMYEYCQEHLYTHKHVEK